EQGHGILHVAGIVLAVDIADTGGRAALDLILQTRARARGEETIGAIAQLEQPMQRILGFLDRATAWERAEIMSSTLLRTTMINHARKFVIAGDKQVWITFIIA